ncbi:MAG: hypothetical protein M3389_06620, partial [Actinomycetota bacterium]|nr:hypothetical protein [Actinomycetota bacterium]
GGAGRSERDVLVGPGAGVDTVVDWLDRQEITEPQRVLRAKEADAAGRQLRAVASLDHRNRGTTDMSAGSLLAA